MVQAKQGACIIEEDTMHPDITQALAAEKIRNWQAGAAAAERARQAHAGRPPASAHALGRLTTVFSRHSVPQGASDCRNGAVPA
jgi:hypothetical protein